jgi:hypothetical protein
VPIASDTVPITAAAIASERREMGSEGLFITVILVVAKDALADVAPQLPGVYGVKGLPGGGVAELRSICGTATNKPLTRPALLGNTDPLLIG